MAKRNSRTRPKNPDLRIGGGRAAKAARAQQRQARAETTTETNVKLRVRPAGSLGFMYMSLLGWAVAALVAAVGLYLGRWNAVSYPDSLWLYASIGALTAAAGVGRIARTSADANSWGVQSLLVPLALFGAELILGPSCPTGAECGAIGARGSMGIVGSIAVIILLGVLSWLLARWMLDMALRSRPRHGKVRYSFALAVVLGMLLFPGIWIGASLIGLDLWQRSSPGLAKAAKVEVERECYGISPAPELAVRAAPEGYNSKWTTFAVRRANEDRPGLGERKRLPGNWATYENVHPYEATASFNQAGNIVNVTCRRIGPGTGNAVEEDLEELAPANNPLSPQSIGQQFHPRFITQGAIGPTEEGKKLIEEREKEAKAEGKDDAKGKDDATSKD